ncbi:MAG TPA: amidohydrolase family protein [Verrucomicrobiales bacterium]|nr:amidohydrolase family protein [Verrucomicrobiales bacterium]
MNGETVSWPATALVGLIGSMSLGFAQEAGSGGLPDVREAALSPETWRRELRLIDLHQHIEAKAERFERAVRIMDRAGIGIGVVLGAGSVVRPNEGEDRRSEFEKVKELADRLFPGRFLHAMRLDYTGWDDSDWGERAARQVEEGRRLGASGLKEFKRLGLGLRDAQGVLLRVDDPKLDPVWRKCGELGMPVSIHVGDPRAFWLPFDESNERWAELRDHRSWWFGDRSRYPERMELLEALNRVIARHRDTTFICVHFANNAEDLAWVERALDAHPNMMADVAARIPEFGRHAPEEVRRLFEKHQDRIVFATDFMVYDRLTLGSAGDDERPTDEDAAVFFEKHWRFFETADRDWKHMTPIQGDWTISSIDLPRAVLRKVYFDNARRVLARSLPAPVARATRIERDWVPDGTLEEMEWTQAVPARVEYGSKDSIARPELSTAVRALWSERFLYLAYECPYTEISVFSPAQEGERIGLWENDVVEAFIGVDPERPGSYTEFEWAPNGERLDLKLDLPDKDFEWSSGMEPAARIDEAHRIWRVEVRIPWTAFGKGAPEAGERWRINFYRHDKASGAGLAWRPTLTGTFHEPARFGWLEFGDREEN